MTQKAAQMENGITNSSISRRARRAAALGLHPSAALSPPRLRHRCAPRAQLCPGPDPEGGPGRENGITDSSADYTVMGGSVDTTCDTAFFHP